MTSDPILFVDDNLVCSLENCDYLREQGLKVLAVYDAPAALEFIKRREKISALVTDIDLGPGDDGFDVARWARAAYPDVPVIFISGTAAGRHLTEGVCDSAFISKPLHPQQILDALNGVIHAEAA